MHWNIKIFKLITVKQFKEILCHLVNIRHVMDLNIFGNIQDLSSFLFIVSGHIVMTWDIYDSGCLYDVLQDCDLVILDLQVFKCLFVLALCTCYGRLYEIFLDKEWEDFKRIYSKTYTEQDEKIRSKNYSISF